MKWSGEPPLLYLEHGGEQRQAPLRDARRALEFAYVHGAGLDIMVSCHLRCAA